MKIIFLGYAVPNANKYSGMSIAGNKMQLGLLTSLAQKDIHLDCFSIVPVAPYPIEKRIIFKRKNLAINDAINTVAVGFINIPVIKQIHQTISLINQATKVATKEDIVLTFNAFPQIGFAALWLKFFKKSKFIPFLADLPLDDLEERNIYSKLLRNVFDASTKKIINFADKIIVLNKEAALKFAPKKKYLCIEGGVDDQDLNRFCALKKEKKKIVYTGALTAYSGIRQMIEAMELITDPDVTLEIYGSGPLEQEVIKSTNARSNVIFHGKKPHDEILKIQTEAYLLVNTRSLDDAIACVTFPSKIFEYMLSGTPVLSSKLNCFNSDFDELIYFSDNNNPETLAKKINQILKKSHHELKSITYKSYNFVSSEKHWCKQSEKIVKFLSETKINI